jgi:uncharacterized protein YrrD
MFGKVGHALRTFSLLRGMPIYHLSSGKKMGDVCDLSISDNGKVTGLLVKKGAFLKQNYFLAIENVSSFGWDGVMVEDTEQLEKLKSAPEYTFVHQRPLSGKMLLSKSGDTLGLLRDVYFQEEVGTIVGYEVTDGFFTDLTEGKKVIETYLPPAIGKDAIVVDVNDS